MTNKINKVFTFLLLFFLNTALLNSQTINGWQQISSPSNQPLRSVDFRNANFGIIAGWGGIVKIINDGGYNWNEQRITGQNGINLDFNAVMLNSNNTGIITGEDGLIGSYSNMGGGSVMIQASNTGSRLNSVAFLEGQQIIMAVGDNGTIVTGNSDISTSPWTVQPSNTQNVLYSVSPYGFAVGSDGIILKSDPYGTRWTILSTGRYPDLYSCFFIDSHTGWAAGQNGFFIKTNDGGVNWFNLNSGTGNNFKTVFFTDPNNGWAAGFNGIIIHTTNGGNSWTNQSVSSNHNINSIFFIDSFTGWFVTDEGNVFKTTTGGVVDLKSPKDPNIR